jgi:GxxExxY protein
LKNFENFPQITQMTQISDQDQRDPRTYAVIGAAIEVHRVLGTGFLEAEYHEALTHEFTLRGIPLRCQVELPVRYKTTTLDTIHRADFVCFDSVIVELKALSNTGGTEETQVINYLKATGDEIGLLLNFGNKSLEYQRFVSSPS